VALGRWDDAERELAQVVRSAVAVDYLPIWLARGQLGEARTKIDELLAEGWDESRPESRAWVYSTQADLLLAEGKPADALSRAEQALAEHESLVFAPLRLALPAALESAATLRDGSKLDELLGVLETLPPGHMSPRLRALAARYGARRAALRDEPGAEEGFAAAEAIWREVEFPYFLAQTLLDHAEWLAAESRAAEAELLLAEAQEIFERLRATPWLERVARCRAGAGEAVA
jgi:hypothetical protein